MAGTPEAALALWATRKHWSHLDNLVEFHLFNFNEDASRKLGVLFNPLDRTQQETFRGLVKEYLEPKLEGTGMAFKDASFSLAC